MSKRGRERERVGDGAVLMGPRLSHKARVQNGKIGSRWPCGFLTGVLMILLADTPRAQEMKLGLANRVGLTLDTSMVDGGT
jgi:hypothetical protein